MIAKKVALVANTDWYLYNFRLTLARALREQGWEVILISPPGQYVPLIEAEGFAWRKWEVSRRSMSPIGEMWAILRLYGIYRSEKPTLTHHFTIKPVFYGSLVSWLSGAPLVVNTIPGLGYLFLSEKPMPRLMRRFSLVAYRLLLNRPNSVTIFENESNRRFFVEKNLVNPERAFLIEGAGVDIHRYTPSPEPEGVPLVVFPARLLWEKGIGILIEAARLLKPRCALRLVLVGDIDPGNPGSVSRDEVKRWVAEGLVEWWGWQSDMPAVYRQSHLVVLPSFGEGLPTALLEAGASARAVVTSDAPGCRDVVEDGYNGLLVPPQNASALAVAIQRLLEDPALRRKMGHNARQRVEQRFSDAHIIARTLEVYEHCLHLLPGRKIQG